MNEEGHLWREPESGEPEKRDVFEVDWKGKYSMAEVYAIATAALILGFFAGHWLWR